MISKNNNIGLKRPWYQRNLLPQKHYSIVVLRFLQQSLHIIPYFAPQTQTTFITYFRKKITSKIKQKIINHLTSDTANIQINALSIRTKVHLSAIGRFYYTYTFLLHPPLNDTIWKNTKDYTLLEFSMQKNTVYYLSLWYAKRECGQNVQAGL